MATTSFPGFSQAEAEKSPSTPAPASSRPALQPGTQTTLSTRTRRRSTAVRDENPAHSPITQSDQALSRLVRSISAAQRYTQGSPSDPDAPGLSLSQLDDDNYRQAQRFGRGRAATVDDEEVITEHIEVARPQNDDDAPISEHIEHAASQETRSAPLLSVEAIGNILELSPTGDIGERSTVALLPSTEELRRSLGGTSSALYPVPSPNRSSFKPFKSGSLRAVGNTLDKTTLDGLGRSTNMNYNNSFENQQGSQGQPRQAPPSPSANMNHANGMNGGGMGLGGAMLAYPTPAGHQADLNHIMAMLEEFGQVVAHNKKLTQDVVEKAGLIREKAKTQDLSNDEMIALVAGEVQSSTTNLDLENSQLRKALLKAQHGERENWKLVEKTAAILGQTVEQVHAFKEKHESDALAWHKSYRDQLAVEREENLELRCRITDMQAHAAKAMEYNRLAMRVNTDSDMYHELRVQNAQYRGQARFWKRLALPLFADDSDEFSGDEEGSIPQEEANRHEAEIAQRRADNRQTRDFNNIPHGFMAEER